MKYVRIFICIAFLMVLLSALSFASGGKAQSAVSGNWDLIGNLVSIPILIFCLPAQKYFISASP
jgi:hypothetical protein